MSKTSNRDWIRPDGLLLPIGTTVVILRPNLHEGLNAEVVKHVEGMNYLKVTASNGSVFHAMAGGNELEPSL